MNGLGALTTASIVRPLPDLTGAMAPQAPLNPCDCSTSIITDLQCAIANHPFMTIAVVVTAAFMMGGKRRRA